MIHKQKTYKEVKQYYILFVYIYCIYLVFNNNLTVCHVVYYVDVNSFIFFILLQLCRSFTCFIRDHKLKSTNISDKQQKTN